MTETCSARSMSEALFRHYDRSVRVVSAGGARALEDVNIPLDFSRARRNRLSAAHYRSIGVAIRTMWS